MELEMSENQLTISEIAPFLRGLTFDGEKGKIVVFSEKILDATAAEAVGGMSVELTAPDRSQAFERLAAVFSAFGPAHPKVVACRPLGSFIIADSYDAARAVQLSVEKGAGLPNPETQTGGRASPVSGGAAFTVADRSRVVQGKVSVVTGGAQGFGEEIVRHLASAGSLVFIADLNLAGAGSLADTLNREHSRSCAFPVGVDISNEDSVRAMVDHVVATVGGIDLFVSNAGVLKAGSVKDFDAKDFEFVTKVNYSGYFLCVKWVSQIMALQNRPSGAYFSDILQINSKSGLEGSNKNGAYAGSKFGGIGLTQSFALELIADNVKVNSICPGNFFDGPLWSDPDRGLFVQYLRTGKVPGAKSVEDVKRYYEGRVPMGRGCTGTDVIKAIYYVIEQKYETGQAIPVTGGQVMLS